MASIYPTKKDKANKEVASTSLCKPTKKCTGLGNRKGLGHPDLKLKQVFQPKHNLCKSLSPKRFNSVGKSLVSSSHRSATPSNFNRPQTPTRF